MVTTRARRTVTNDYAAMVGGYESTPKSVLAAIVVRLLLRHGSNLTSVSVDVLDEWKALHQLGIVPQSPGAFWHRPHKKRRTKLEAETVSLPPAG